MNKYIKSFAVFLAVASVFSFAARAHAMVPALSVSATGNSDSVLVDVTGDPNANVSFNYNLTSNMQTRSLGTTDSTGLFSTTISTSAYGIVAGGSVYVVVNGQQSQYATWPTTYGGSTLSFSQTSITLTPSQQSTISVYNATSSLYISNNANQSVASAFINGSTISVSGITAGSTTISVCENGLSACGTIYVTVSGGGASALSFSQNSVSLINGQTTTVSVYNVTNTLYISSNSNSNITSATLSGNTVLLTGLTAGTSNIVICENGLSACGTISTTVTGAGGSPIIFSQTSVSLSQGQSVLVTASNIGSGLYISNNSSISVATASINGASINIYGNSMGTTTLTVCQANTSLCGTIYVTVGNTSGSSSGITFSQTSVALATGQTTVISAYNTTSSLYISSNINPGVATATINGTGLSLYGNVSGNTTIAVCETNTSICGSIYVTVGLTGGNTGQALSFNQINITNLTLTPSQSATLSAMNTSGILYVSSNSSASVATATVSGTNIIVTGLSAGTTNMTLCQTSYTCGVISVTVVSNTPASSVPAVIPGCVGTVGFSTVTGQSCALNTGGNTTTTTGSTTTTTTTTAPVKYVFTLPLKYGSSGPEVSALQNKLTTLGIYSGPINGLFGPLTEQAVKAFQVKNGLTPLGNVGPATRIALNNS